MKRKYYDLEKSARFISDAGLIDAPTKEIRKALVKGFLLSPHAFIGDVKIDLLRETAKRLREPLTKIDDVVYLNEVETAKRIVAKHLLKQPRYVDCLSNETIAAALGWGLDDMLEWWKEADPKVVIKEEER
jgi:hypothetical protein